MAHSVLAQRVITAPNDLLSSQDSASNQEQIGAMAVGLIDITSYPTGGETITAEDCGLSTLYTLQLFGMEGAGVPQMFKAEGAAVTGALGASAVVSAYDLATPTEIANATDIGVCQFIATGEVERLSLNTSAPAV